MTADPAAFVRERTAVKAPPLVPEIGLHVADEITPLWQATEETLAAEGLEAPYWAFAWAGGQALARHFLDHPDIVTGRRVLDIGAGSGIAAIAAAKAGAARVTAADTDPFAAAAIRLNAAHNGAEVVVVEDDLMGTEPRDAEWDVIVAGDVCYQRDMAGRFAAWLRSRAAAGALVLLGDPGRAYRPDDGLEELARYNVPTSREIEDSEVKETVIWRVTP